MTIRRCCINATAFVDKSKPGQELKLRRIPKISNRLVITPSIQRLFSSYVERLQLSDGDYLFRSNKGGGPLTLVSLSRLVIRLPPNVKGPVLSEDGAEEFAWWALLGLNQ